MFKINRFDSSKYNKEDLILFSFTLECHNLNDGSCFRSKGTIYFYKYFTLEDILLYFDKKFNTNQLKRGLYACSIRNINDIWKQHGFKNTYAIESYIENYTLYDLSNIFDLDSFIFHIYIGYGYGGGYGENEGFKYIIHADETKQHHRRHIHVKKAGEKISVDLDTLEVISGKFKRSKDIRKAIRDIARNQEGLIREWDNLQNDKIKSDFVMHFD